jgi:beta-phosphoglucomutase-like phosphatase (HAD superfamily)
MSTRAALPEGLRACLFDLDGVLTRTALVHSAAWKQMFDAFLAERARRTGTAFEPFTDDDYNRYVDGKQRDDGTRSFVASRGIDLPQGSDDDPPGAETVHGLSRAKNDARVDGVTAREQGLPGKPAPDTFLQGARTLGVEPAEAAVFEDALAGVQAGRAGAFGWVVGVDRISGGTGEHTQALLAHGADVVVGDLSEIDLSPTSRG